MNIALLREKFKVPGLRFEQGENGLIRAVIETPVASGEVYLQGAHVTAYQPSGSKPVLWVSKQALFEPSKPIRGGVPICFPWFGAHQTDPKAPAHGSARAKEWEFLSAVANEAHSLSIRLGTTIDGLRVDFYVSFGTTLHMNLQVSLPDSAADRKCFEAALHTYFSVSDIHAVSIQGLESNGYIDKVGGTTPRLASGEAIRFSSELDRVYQDTDATCVLQDPGFHRSIAVEKTNSKSTVVWNPWIAKSARMADFGDDEWQEMLCIETANVGENAIILAPSESHSMTATISVDLMAL